MDIPKILLGKGNERSSNETIAFYLSHMIAGFLLAVMYQVVIISLGYFVFNISSYDTDAFDAAAGEKSSFVTILILISYIIFAKWYFLKGKSLADSIHIFPIKSRILSYVLFVFLIVSFTFNELVGAAIKVRDPIATLNRTMASEESMQDSPRGQAIAYLLKTTIEQRKQLFDDQSEIIKGDGALSLGVYVSKESLEHKLTVVNRLIEELGDYKINWRDDYKKIISKVDAGPGSEAFKKGVKDSIIKNQDDPKYVELFERRTEESITSFKALKELYGFMISNFKEYNIEDSQIVFTDQNLSDKFNQKQQEVIDADTAFTKASNALVEYMKVDPSLQESIQRVVEQEQKI